VGVDLGNETDGDRTRWVAADNDSEGPDAVEYLIGVLDFIAWRRATKASVELIVRSVEVSEANCCSAA
jgi:hypothetical protein